MTHAHNASEKAILKARAHELAKPREDSKTIAKERSFICFCLGLEQDEKYALSYRYVERVVALQALTPIPTGPAMLLGITYHNAEIWPVIDTEVLFDFSCGGTIEPEYIVLIKQGSHHFALATRYIVGHVQLGTDKLSLLAGKKNKSYTLGVYPPDIAIIDDTAIFNVLRQVDMT